MAYRLDVRDSYYFFLLYLVQACVKIINTDKNT